MNIEQQNWRQRRDSKRCFHRCWLAGQTTPFDSNLVDMPSVSWLVGPSPESLDTLQLWRDKCILPNWLDAECRRTSRCALCKQCCLTSDTSAHRINPTREVVLIGNFPTWTTVSGRWMRWGWGDVKYHIRPDKFGQYLFNRTAYIRPHQWVTQYGRLDCVLLSLDSKNTVSSVV